jgi:hypothetical protein
LILKLFGTDTQQFYTYIKQIYGPTLYDSYEHHAMKKYSKHIQQCFYSRLRQVTARSGVLLQKLIVIVSQDILRFSQNPKVQYCILKSLFLDLILSHRNQFQTFISYLRYILIFSFHLSCFHSGFPAYILYKNLIFTMRATYSAYLIFLDLIALIIL